MASTGRFGGIFGELSEQNNAVPGSDKIFLCVEGAGAK
jgi:hypothetical protein